MNNLLNLKYWFNIRPGNLETGIQNTFIIFLFVLLAIGLAVHWYFIKRKSGLYLKLWKKIRTFSFTNIIIGLLLLFFTYEYIPFLSARILFLFWGVGMIAWLGSIACKFKEIPKIKEARAKEEEFKKYVP